MTEKAWKFIPLVERANTDERKARIAAGSIGLDVVRDYLPANYTADQSETGSDIIITGHDDHGWTLDGYVIPRLASGLIWAREMKEEE